MLAVCEKKPREQVFGFDGYTEISPIDAELPLPTNLQRFARSEG